MLALIENPNLVINKVKSTNPLAKLPYRELQKEAIKLDLPANAKHKVLLGMVLAKQANRKDILDLLLKSINNRSKRGKDRLKKRMKRCKVNPNSDKIISFVDVHETSQEINTKTNSTSKKSQVLEAHVSEPAIIIEPTSETALSQIASTISAVSEFSEELPIINLPEDFESSLMSDRDTWILLTDLLTETIV